MTTGSTNTTFDHSTDANFRAWGNELMTMLITTLGLTQTADTGQLAFPMTATTRPGTNTAAGYYILRFNDTLQATTPIFIKIEPATGGTTTSPGLYVTVGTGSNGSGTLTGLSTRVAVALGGAPLSSVANYVSRACYNPTQGVLWIDWKQSGTVANESSFGFMICRSVDNTGAPNGNAIGFQGASTSATFSLSSGQPWQWYNANTAAWLGPVAGTPTGSSWAAWTFGPYSSTTTQFSTVYGTAGQVFPCFQYAPTASAAPYGIMNAMAVCNLSEIALAATITTTILGSTSLTYICGQGCGSSIGVNALGIAAYGILRLWQ